MRRASRHYLAFTYSLLACAVAHIPAFAQASPATSTKLSVGAVVVLTPDFCATKLGMAEVGKAVCPELEAALKTVFDKLTSVPEVPKTAEARLVLIPTFANTGATQGRWAFSDRDLDIYLQWTAKDQSGKTLWIQTVEGSATHHMGNVFTYRKNIKLIVSDAAKDVAAKSAIKISTAEQIRALSR